MEPGLYPSITYMPRAFVFIRHPAAIDILSVVGPELKQTKYFVSDRTFGQNIVGSTISDSTGNRGRTHSLSYSFWSNGRWQKMVYLIIKFFFPPTPPPWPFQTFSIHVICEKNSVIFNVFPYWMEWKGTTNKCNKSRRKSTGQMRKIWTKFIKFQFYQNTVRTGNK